jgi:hypothetical protein
VVIIALAGIFAPADTAVFIVRGLHQLTIAAEYDASKATLAISGTGADARIVELAIAAFVGLVGYVLSRDRDE